MAEQHDAGLDGARLRLFMEQAPVTLFWLDSMLRGEINDELQPLRISEEQYAEARAAIAVLYHILKHPRLEKNSKYHRVAAAKGDSGFQAFMAAARRKPSRRSAGNARRVRRTNGNASET